jgi:hypothetical protein
MEGGGRDCVEAATLAPTHLSEAAGAHVLTACVRVIRHHPPPPPAGSATLSMAVAAERFVNSLLRAIQGEAGVTECAFVESPVVPGVPYFSTRITLSKDGVAAIAPIGPLSPSEAAGLEKMKPELVSSIEKGVAFAKAWVPK